MATKKGNTIKGIKLAGTALAVMRVGDEWRPIVRSFHRHDEHPEVCHLSQLEHLKPAQQRKVQGWIKFLEPANAQASKVSA